MKLFAERGGESVATDADGNVYVAAGQIFAYNSRGESIGTIDVPERPIDLVFGGKDGQTLFILARTSLYSVRIASRSKSVSSLQENRRWTLRRSPTRNLIQGRFCGLWLEWSRLAWASLCSRYMNGEGFKEVLICGRLSCLSRRVSRYLGKSTRLLRTPGNLATIGVKSSRRQMARSRQRLVRTVHEGFSDQQAK